MITFILRRQSSRLQMAVVQSVLEKRPPQYLKTLQKVEKLYSRYVGYAKKLVPQLFTQLEDAGIKPYVARYYIVHDLCPHYWEKETVEIWLPARAKHEGKSYAGHISRIKVNEKREKEFESVVNAFLVLRNEPTRVKNLIKEHVLPKVKQAIDRSAIPPGCRVQTLHNVEKITFHITKKSKGPAVYLPAGSSCRIYTNEDGKLVNAGTIA